jgi:hypothetical protein
MSPMSEWTDRVNDCFLDYDVGSLVCAVEASPAGVTPQSVWVRVGPVWDNGKRRREPGVWVEYQEDHMAGPMTGPVLLTPAVWRELDRYVKRKLRRQQREPLWRRWLSRLCGW